MEEHSKSPLPEAFLGFLEEYGIYPSIYTASGPTPPYLRLKPGSEGELEEIEAEINCKLEKVNWLPGFYSLPPDVLIANSKSYLDGKIYGIDAASGAAVSVLKISSGDHILDLCAAPECTHDGSVKHIQKFEHWGWRTLQRRVLDAERTDSLTVLQLKLLRNGFRLLKVGGLLVYSTCSLTVAPNDEDIVEQLLKENASAELQEIHEAKEWPCKSGRIPKTLRFDPLTSQTSGLFVSKFSKLAT
ncbi:uncharacterized protein LOC120141624 [Hibiscus syriacus]|uniref:uncharacterized protein LOC120141624 n=1 Tax=Hibiscus syriacus TaxID=106335 RepID=UPI001923876C|nr:uncharacterized protein LOC120141624 [Hibiscus syriacus]XP_039012372.1 uncharacterized protein LOC120141624 [Hibiscus syriacus]